MTCRTAVFVLASVLAASLPVTAQTSAVAADITVTGCLQRGIDGKFVVANADVPAGDDKLTRVAPAGASDPIPSGKTVQNWWLQGETDLEEHVGRRIEVTGRELATPADTVQSTPGAVGTSGTRSSDPGPGDAKDEPAHKSKRLEVKAVKVLAASCS